MDERVDMVLDTVRTLTRDNDGVVIEPLDFEDGVLRIKYYEGVERGLPGVRDAARLVQGNGRAHVPRPGAARRVRVAGARPVAPTAGTGRRPPSPRWARWA